MKMWKIKTANKIPEEYGYNITSDPRVANVNWDEQDLYGGKWTEDLVRNFLGLGEDAVIYKTLADISDLNENLSEEDLEDLGEDSFYDWSELQSRRSNPPPIVITRTKNDRILIHDGNHRVRYWKEVGKTYIPSWCYDEKITEWKRENENL